MTTSSEGTIHRFGVESLHQLERLNENELAREPNGNASAVLHELSLLAGKLSSQLTTFIVLTNKKSTPCYKWKLFSEQKPF